MNAALTTTQTSTDILNRIAERAPNMYKMIADVGVDVTGFLDGAFASTPAAMAYPTRIGMAAILAMCAVSGGAGVKDAHIAIAAAAARI